MSPGNRPTVHGWIIKWGWIGSRAVQIPNALTPGRYDLDVYLLTCVFRQVSPDLSAPICGVAMFVSQLLLYSDMVLIMVQ
jgi:hypothetical protein